MKTKTLNDKHKEHLLSEGFSEGHVEKIIKDGLTYSVTAGEAEVMGFGKRSGQIFCIQDDFLQIRYDDPPVDKRKNRPIKYKTAPGIKAQARIPENCQVVTEGLKDGLAGCLIGGVPTGVVAGVSHIRKTVQKGAGYTLLFDSDGWSNPQVFAQLIHGAIHLNGKVQLVPDVPGEPKAGLCEFFNHVKNQGLEPLQEYQNLLDSAKKPIDMLMEWPKRWQSLDNETHLKCLRTAIKLTWLYMPSLQRDAFFKAIAKAAGVTIKAVRDELNAWSSKQLARENKKSTPKGAIPVEYNEKTGQPILPSSSHVANFLTEKYRSTLSFNGETESFFRYERDVQGRWDEEHPRAVELVIQSELDAAGLDASYGAGYVSSVYKLMAARLYRRSWNEQDGFVPLRNGVCEISTGRLHEHSPGFGFTWQLPYPYDPGATCEPILEWLKESQDGDMERFKVLLSWLKAVVTSRVDLQRFMQCIGPGGTGKSTYQRLAVALVGLENTYTTELRHLESNRFETSGIYGKRLVVISDSERYGGSVSVLKSLTGQDPIRMERKNQQQTSGFIPKAMVMVAANEPIQSSDYTSGLERRRLDIPFTNRIAPSQQRDLLTITNLGMSGEFVPYLPGLFNLAMSVSDNDVDTYIKNTKISAPSLNRWMLESLLDSNPIAEWIDSCCVFLDNARTNVGIKQEDRSQNAIQKYIKTDEWLYASYCERCHQTGSKPVGLRRFVTLLEDLCRTQLGRPEVRRHRDRGGSHFVGIAIRTAKHENLSNSITGITADVMDEPSLVTVRDGSVTAETLGSDECDGCDGFFQLNPNNPKKELPLQPSISNKPKTQKDQKNADNPSHPSHSSPTRVSAVIPSVTVTDESLVSPSQSPPTPAFRVGDRVDVTYRLQNHPLRSGTILAVNGDAFEIQFKDRKVERIRADYLKIRHQPKSSGGGKS